MVRAHVDRLGAVGRQVLTRLPGVDAGTADRATSLAVLAMQGHVVNAAVLPDEAGAARLLESLELAAAAVLGIGVPAGAARRPGGGASPC